MFTILDNSKQINRKFTVYEYIYTWLRKKHFTGYINLKLMLHTALTKGKSMKRFEKKFLQFACINKNNRSNILENFVFFFHN